MTELLAQTDVELIARKGLKEFIIKAWSQVEPATEFVDSWHLTAIVEHLEAISRGEITRLLITIPPGTGKTLPVSCFWQPWEWTFRPETKWIFASHDFKISMRDTRRARLLIDSPWYQARWGHLFSRNEDEWRLTKFSNSHAGFRIAASSTSTITGEHADRQICDDPIKAQDVTSTMLTNVPACEKVFDWWTGTMPTRLIPKPTSSRVIIMQRLHEADLAGRMIEEGGYVHLNLPMEFEPDRKCFTSIGFEDPRTKEGELLWPAVYDEKAVALKKKELGERVYAAQYQQRPAPAKGSLFLREWLGHFWTEIPKPFGEVIMSFDCTFSNQGDWTVGQIWMKKDARFFLLDQIRGRMTFVETQAAIVAFSSKWPMARLKLIEAAANGVGIVDSLKTQITGIVAEPVGGKSKEIRAASVTPMFEAGNVFLPHPNIAPWINDYIEEMAVFPSGRHDDCVDATSQALNRLRDSPSSIYLKALNRLS